MVGHRYSYDWSLKDADFTRDKGTVFSCFACGGGSTMGYKLAGFDVIGCNEIDPRMNKVYVENHHPKYNYLEPIQTFKDRKDLPEELYHLDVLDGSPPCSSFSAVGSRGEMWGKKKKFREGQAEQVLDTLFFDFIDLAKELQPKVIVAENVKGLLFGDAINYVRGIYDGYDDAGYYCQHFLLDASSMGVPQKRERVFFIGLRKDLAGPFLKPYGLFEERPELKMEFNEKPITYGEVKDTQARDEDKYFLTSNIQQVWAQRRPEDTGLADIIMRIGQPRKWFSWMLNKDDCVSYTLTAHRESLISYNEPRYMTDVENCRIGTFPKDYNFCGEKSSYIVGMSVPPVMMAQIATNLWEQWLQYL